MYKLLISYKNNKYKFLAFELRDHIDGSLNIVFDRDKLGSERMTWTSEPGSTPASYNSGSEKLRISYHASGRINFHGIKSQAIYGDPTFAINSFQWLSYISVPKIESLTLVKKISPSDTIIKLPSNLEGRVTFSVIIGPVGGDLNFSPLVVVTYQNWFNLIISLDSFPLKIPSGLENHVLKAVPSKGLYVSQQVSTDEALIAFNQIKTNLKSLITSWEPNEGVYRIVFNVPMRIPPRLNIEWVHTGIKTDIVKKTRSEIRFRAKGRGGYLKSIQQIKSIELDAEL